MNCPTCGLDIDEHPANRCLDAWVAREVMGLTVCTCHIPLVSGLDIMRCMTCGGTVYPDYSTHIAAACEVVRYLSNRAIEIVVAEGFSGNLSACMMYEGTTTPYPPRDAFLHLATIEQASSDFGSLCIHVQAETVPLAICKAALLAILQE